MQARYPRLVLRVAIGGDCVCFAAKATERGFSNCRRPAQCDAALDRAARPRKQGERSTGHAPHSETRADDHAKLRKPLVVESDSVRGGEPRDHSELVDRQYRQICARDRSPPPLPRPFRRA